MLHSICFISLEGKNEFSSEDISCSRVSLYLHNFSIMKYAGVAILSSQQNFITQLPVGSYPMLCALCGVLATIKILNKNC